MISRLAVLLNTRVLALVLGLIIFWQGPGISSLGWLDRQLFSLGIASRPTPQYDLALDLVTLSADDGLRWQQDPAGADDLLALVELLDDAQATVGLLLPNLPNLMPSRAENLLLDLDKADIYYPEWAALAVRREQIQNWLDSPQVILGSRDQALVARSVRAAGRPNDPQDWHQWLGARQPYVLHSSQRDSGIDLWPLALRADNQLPPWLGLLWRTGDQLYPAFTARLLQAWQGSSVARWHAQPGPIAGDWLGGDLLLGERRYRLGPGAGLTPAISRTDPLAGVQRIDLAGYLALAQPGQVVLLALADDPAAIPVAAAVRDLASGHYYVTPGWYEPAFRLLILGLLAYLLLITRVPGSVAILLTLLLTGVLLALQWGAMVVHSQWLPLGVAIQYLLVGLLLVWLWRQRREQLLAWRQGYYRALARLGRAQLALGQLKDAEDSLLACEDLTIAADDWYELAVQLERKRRPEDALAIYQRLAQWRASFRDVRERLEQLSQPQPLGAINDLSKTLALSPAHTRPLLGRYEVERELGRGAMGTVYLARDPRISRAVAIKTLSYDSVDPAELDAVKQRFLREAEAAGRLRHPNIVTVYDAGEDQELAYIAMDYVDGFALSDVVIADKLLPVPDVYRIMVQVADALAYAHERDIVHRDIKPGNILYQPDTGQALVTDFGVARITSDARTQTGEILGSPVYMSPEQVAGHKVTPASDIFSLGVTFYQLLCGELPFRAPNLAGLSYQIIHGKPRPLRELRTDLPGSATRIINKALQKDVRKRYASAEEMARSLRTACARDFDITL